MPGTGAGVFGVCVFFSLPSCLSPAPSATSLSQTPGRRGCTGGGGTPISGEGAPESTGQAEEDGRPFSPASTHCLGLALPYRLGKGCEFRTPGWGFGVQGWDRVQVLSFFVEHCTAEPLDPDSPLGGCMERGDGAGIWGLNISVLFVWFWVLANWVLCSRITPGQVGCGGWKMDG